MIKPTIRQPRSLKKLFTNTLLITLSSLAITACDQEKQKKITPPPAVSVYEIQMKEIGSHREFVARTVASKEADLRARVEGELIERHFTEGSLVEKDQILLVIDPAEYKAVLSAAKADLNSKKSGERNAASNLKRGKELISSGYITQADFDQLDTTASQAKSAVQSAKASVDQAKLNLSYTTITAPFSGKVGKVNYNIGNIVGPNSDVLAHLTLTHPIYVSFQLEESKYISYLQTHKNAKATDKIAFDLSLRLPNNSAYPEPGKFNFSDTKITQGMGTVELRAVFDNPNDIILPGLFVTLILEGKTKQNMALVPQAAVQVSQLGKFVLVVDKDNSVKQRTVILERRINAMWVVKKGLKAGEKVIIEGLQKVKPGIEVKPVISDVDPLTGTISTKELP